MTRKRLAWFTLAALLAGLAALAYPYFEVARFGHDVTGVDVSHYQGTIDWDRVARAKVAFAYIKATEGTSYVDTRFAENWQRAARSGVPRGAYHFFRHCKPGKAQAAHFIARVPKDVFALPPAIDVEDMRECSGASFDPVVKISDFLDAVEAYFGCRPLIYTTPQYEQAYLSGALSRERFWLRSIHLPPAYRRSDWVFWQYHHMGRRPGISGPVDLNAYRGTAADFERFVHSESCGGRKA